MKGDGSLIFLDTMRAQGIVPNKISLKNFINACARLGAMYKIRLIHDFVCCMNFLLDVILGTAIIDMYTKCESADSIREIFATMREKNLTTWSAMIRST